MISFLYVKAYSYFKKGCQEKSIKVRATGPKAGFGITGILYIGLEEMYKLYFCT